MAGVPIEDILHRGRWASTKSARHYVQSGRALLLAEEVPPLATTLARVLVANVLRVMMTLSQ